ncbi:MAG: TonB-dependent receptor plug domain-containing protein [Flavobacteriales bacterium]|nr:TonB-dependent receptor plug domain-containing protein [Flavobacteriales bacterium]
MRKMIIAGFLLANLSAISQKASIVGIAIDSLNNHVMKGAELVLQPGYQIQYTDSNGYFTFSNLSNGSYEISGSHLGCIVTTQNITIIGQEIIQKNVNFVCHEIIDTTIPILSSETLSEVIIEATRATSITPMTYNDLSKQYIEHINTSQDIPQLLRYTPSLVATSDAGNGVGYTGLWIRGSDPSRINVTINGIPLNDPESQQVFWVNTPDLASSASNIQIQRGIGTSANGAASFGGNIKIETRDVRTSPYAEIKNSFGSFNTMRNTINVGTGLIHQKFVFEGRLSRIVSDGYIDRATSDLKSYFLEGNYMDRKTTIKMSMFGGREKTYQSWNGTPVSVLQNNQDSIFQFAARNYLDDAQLSNLLNSGRTYNFYEYENQSDNYGQDHYQLHISREMTSNLRFNLSGHYTHGEGYYEEFKAFQDYNSYGLDHIVTGNDTVTTTDLVRKRWLKNDYYGLVASLNYRRNAFESSLGGAFNEYIGNHYGEIIWMQFAGPYENNLEYYRGRSVKHDGNIYWRNSYLIQKTGIVC